VDLIDEAGSASAGRRTGWILGLVALAWFAVLARVSPFSLGDEGYLYYIAWRIQQGDVPFRDIELFSYTPGLFYAWSGWFHLFGASTAAARALSVGLAAINVVLLHRSFRTVGCGPRLAVVATIVAMLGYPWLYRSHLVLINLAALLLAVRSVRGGAWLSLAGLGALAVIGAAVRIDAAATAAALAGGVLLLRLEREPGTARFFRDLGPVLAGACTAMLLVAAGFAWAGVLGGWLRQLAGFASLASDRSTAWYKLPFPGFGGALKDDLLSLLMLSSAALVVLAGFEAWLARRRGGDHWRLLAILAVFGLLNLPQFLVERPDSAHFADHGFAMLLVLAALIARPPRHVAETLRLPAKAAAVIAPACAGAWVLGYGLGASRWNGFALGTALQPGQEARLAGERIRLPKDPELGSDLRFLDTVLGRNEPLASLPFGPGANFLLRRPLPGRQVNFFPFNPPESGRELLASLANPRLRFLLIQPGFQLSPDPRANLVCYAPAVSAAVESKFRPVDVKGDYWLLQRGGASKLPAADCRPRR
jgi:hypothetical protein